MNGDAPTKLTGESESEVWNAISAFERILEAMPTDRVALETLSDAYSQIGQTSRAIEYLARLGQCIVDENDVSAAPAVLEKLRSVEHSDGAAEEVAEHLEQMFSDVPGASVNVGSVGGGTRKNFDIAHELSLAWNLLQAEELSQEDYSGVVHDLSEQSSKSEDGPISVLHVLRQRNFPELERVIAFLSKDSGTPIVALAHFEIQKQVTSRFTPDSMIKQGAIAFELMGRELLVAVINPYDTELRKQVEEKSGRKCHFYLVSPTDFDAASEEVRQSLAPAA